MKKITCFNTNAAKKFLLLFIIMLLLPAALKAQKATEDVVYLKNGSIIRGNITEIKIEEYVKIEITGGSIFYFQMNEVLSITKEPAFKENSKGEYQYKDKGYFNETGFSLLFGRDYSTYNNNSDVSLEFHTVNGYQFDHLFRAGVGIGIDYYSNYDVILSPVYLRLAGDLLQKSITPYYNFDVGYGFSWDSENPNFTTTGGFMFSPGVGVKFNSRSAASYIISLSYRNQKSEREQSDWWGGGKYTTSYTFKRVALGFSISF